MDPSIVVTLPAGQHAFYGLAEVTVLSGTPVVNGAELGAGYSTDIFAPTYTLPVQFECLTEFSLRLTAISRNNVCDRERPFYFPSQIPEGFNEIMTGLFHSPIVKGVQWPNPAATFVDTFTSKKPQVVFVAGGKGVGKSHMTRFICNRVLSKHSSVCLLDIDPGQPEVSIPGCISRTILTDYILNQPEHATKVAEEIRYFGAVTPGTNVNYFIECVKSLAEDLPSDMFVVVNSFGWVRDLGLEIHKHIIEILKPGITIVLHTRGESPAEINKRIFRVEINPRPGITSVTPRWQREARLAGHFLRGKPSLCLQEPIKVDISKVRIGIICEEFDPRETLTAISGSLIALCTDTRTFPPARVKVSLLKEVPPIHCNGFAIVKAIDKENNALYLLTDCEEPFNTAVLGSVPLPEDMYCNTFSSHANYLGIGLLDKAGASTDPLLLKQTPAGH